MGDYISYVKSGGFKEFLYHDVGDIITAGNGVQGKVINGFTDPNDEVFHESLPLYANTSEVYFKKSDKGNHPIEQARIYKDRTAFIDVDWGHTHGEFKLGTIHVHEWIKSPDGTFKRKPPRYANNDEIARYGDLIKKANPHTKLR
jgi:hypothetical protein